MKTILTIWVMGLAAALPLAAAAELTPEEQEAVAQYRKCVEPDGVGLDSHVDRIRLMEQRVETLRLLAQEGDAEAQFELGLCYYTGEGVTVDIVEAVRWFRRAAEQGYAQAQFYLGESHFRGTCRDAAAGVAWYRLAAEQGLPEAQFRLGECYAEGEGVKKDMGKAVELFRAAADQGLPEAIEALNALGE